jgi:uncharacterized protein YjbI with pentapeptide repeats
MTIRRSVTSLKKAPLFGTLMSAADGTCEYVLDPDDPETWGGEVGDKCYVDDEILNEEGVWICPYDAEEGEDLCIFHLPVENKDDKKVVEAFLDEVDDTTESKVQRLHFIGSQFGTFDLTDNTLEIVVEQGEIEMSHVEVGGRFNWSDSVFNTRIRFRGARFDEDTNFGSAKFNKEADFTGVEFRSDTDFHAVEFKRADFGVALFEGDSDFQDAEFGLKANFYATEFGDVDFQNTEFKCFADFRNAEFRDLNFRYSELKIDADFRGAKFTFAKFAHTEFGGDVDFHNTEFSYSSDFERAVFRGDTNFQNSEFFGYTDFSNVEFGGSTDFSISEFEEDACFNFAEFLGDADFQGSEFRGESSKKVERDITFYVESAVDFLGAKFEEEIKFTDTKFRGTANLMNVRFEGAAIFRRAEFEEDTVFTNTDFKEGANFTGVLFQEGVYFDRSNLTDVTFTNTNLCEASLESVLLSRATLFGADLRGAKISGAVLGDTRIDDETKFLGRPSDNSDDKPSVWDTLSELRSGNYCVYDPRYEDDNDGDMDSAKSVYRALEELAGRAARPQLQSTCFVNRQDLQQRQYWGSIGNSDNPLERVINFGKWSRARVARATLLYGESPWRVIAWSLGIVLFFAFSYPAVGGMKPEDGDPITYAQIVTNPIEIFTLIYYSTLTYTALGFGDFQPVGLGRLLTTVETGLGAVMLALLVFILGRRAAR